MKEVVELTLDEQLLQNTNSPQKSFMATGKSDLISEIRNDDTVKELNGAIRTRMLQKRGRNEDSQSMSKPESFKV